MLAPPMTDAFANLRKARLIALAVPAALLAGAYGSQYVGGLWPCEMCWWQRYAHFAALPFAIAALALPLSSRWVRPLVMLAVLAIAVSGAIGIYHSGVEYGWWEGVTTCTTNGAKTLDEILNVPLVRCDQVQWEVMGISLAGFNALFSLGGAALAAFFARRSTRA